MKHTRSLMGMPITIEIVDTHVTAQDIDAVYDHFTLVDETYSPFKDSSQVSQINAGTLQKQQYTKEMNTILALCEQTKQETNGYFDAFHNGIFNPSGLVKGWAIWHAANLLQKKGFQNYYVDAGGDVQVAGKNAEGKTWTVGIQNPFNTKQIVKIVALENQGIATSGTALRGQHVYNPHKPHAKITDIVSLTVIGPNIYEADRFATAAFAMGSEGIHFVERLDRFEGYMIDKNGIATYTTGFPAYVVGDKA